MVDAFSHGFFGDNPDKDSVEVMINKYQKNVKQHILEHYEIYTNTHRRQAITSHQLLYYHVYGDYRLKLVQSEEGPWVPRFVYRTYPHTMQQPSLDTLVTADGNMRPHFFLLPYLREPDPDGERDGWINGVFQEVTRDGGLQHNFGDVDWFNTEMSKQGTGTLFNLPSLGTEIIKLHSYGNASDNIKKALIKELDELVDFYEEKSQPVVFHDDYIYDDDNNAIDCEVLDLINTGLEPTDSQWLSFDDLNPDVSRLTAVFVTSVLSNPEYLELLGNAAVSAGLPDESTIRNTLRRVYDVNNEYEKYGANSAVVNALFAKTGQSFYEGDRVSLTRSVPRNIADRIADQFDLVGNQEERRNEVFNSSYIVTGFIADSDYDDGNGYTLEAIDLISGTNQEVFNQDWLDATRNDRYMFKAANLIKEEEGLDLRGSGDIETVGKKPGKKKKKKKKGGKVVLQPILLVFQRIIMDTFCAIQILVKLGKEYSDTSPTGEAKIRYLSKGVNTYSVTSLTDKQKQDSKKKNKKLKIRDIYHSFPNMTTFNRTSITGTIPAANTKVGNVGYLDKLTKWRAYYTLSILAQIRKKTIERQHMDEFYSNNILVKEVEWLSAALGEGAKVLRKKEEPKDLLAQVQYTYVKGIPSHTSPPLEGHPLIQQTADAPKETVFYEVDMPLLKEVIATYSDVYNDTTIARAFNTEAKIVEKRVPGVLANEEVIEILRQAKQARTDGDNERKGELVGRAIRMQPDAFSVDEPYGSGKTRPEQQDSFPGVSYQPTGHRFQFHIRKEHIPENLAGASDIVPAGEPLGPPIDSTTAEGYRDPAVAIHVKQRTKPVQKGALAIYIWNSIRDRSRGIFDIEGVKPYEFMDYLFDQMDTSLERSNLVKAPYPESWLGTNTVERLRNDPTQLGEELETRFYVEKLSEYVESLKSKYMNNYMVPKVLITAIEQAKIKYTKDPEVLKVAFMERLAKDADRPQLATTDYVLRPYGMTIAIMRGILDISETERDHYVAGEIDDQMREDIRRQMYHNLITPILPKEHPMYKPKPEIETPIPPEPTVDPVAEGLGRIAGVFERAEARSMPLDPTDAEFVEEDDTPPAGQLALPEPVQEPPEEGSDFDVFGAFDASLYDFGGEL